MSIRGVMASAAAVLLLLGAPARATGDTPADADRQATYRRGEAYTHLMRALFASRRGEFGNAASEIQRALALEPDNASLLVEASQLLAWTGRSGEAERALRRALEIEPDHREARLFLADLLMSRAFASSRDGKAIEEAVALYDSLAADPEPDAEILTKLIQLRHRAGDLAGAAASARRLVEARPGDGRAARTLAQLLLQSGDEPGALRVLLHYVAEHPSAVDVAHFAEQLTHNLEAWELAAEVLAPFQPFPLEVDVLPRLLGESLLRLGQPSRAIEVLERAREGHPDDLRVRNHLAVAYRSVGRMADAAELLSELIRESPEFPSLPQLLAEVRALQGDVGGALDSYEAALRGWGANDDAQPMRDAIRQRMALLHLERKELGSARALLGALERPESAAALRIRGRLELDSQDLHAALKTARRLNDLGEKGFAALLEGEALAGQGRWNKARARFDEAIESLGPYTRRTVAEIYRSAGRGDEGLEILRSWADTAPDEADARFLLGEYLYKLDRLDEAEAALREAFTLDPHHAAALNFLGYSLAEHNMRLDEALEMIRRALAVDTWNAAYLDSLGWVLFQMGRFDEARVPLERAARDLPYDATVLEHLGDLYLQIGERDAALTAWQRALASGTDNADGLRRKIEQHAGVDAARGEGTDVDPDDERRLEGAPPSQAH